MSTLAFPGLSASCISENSMSLLRSISQRFRKGISFDSCGSEIFSRGPEDLMKKSKTLNLGVKGQFIREGVKKTGEKHHFYCF